MKTQSIDLHTHSTCSDGSDSPDEVIARAQFAGASAIALTDHDTIEGLGAARKAAEHHGIELVNGIEISAEFSPGTMHILGYCIDAASESLLSELESLREARARRNPEIARRLQDLRVDIQYEEVAALAGGNVVGRPHFAQKLVDKGYVTSIQEAFDKYLAKGRPAYVEKTRLSPPKAIDVIHAAGGVAVLAHPYQLGCRSEEQLHTVVDELVDSGLDGIEAIYSRHRPPDRLRYAELAASRGLVITGGSDYHGTYKPDIAILTGLGDLAVPYHVLEEVRDRAANRELQIAQSRLH
jgi:predicted metal-dependent phosphoesterase TrpH